MNKKELIEEILQEAIYIKNLFEEKKQIEKDLKKLEDDGEEIDETTGLGLGVNNRASHKGEIGKKLKKDESKELQEMALLRKVIRKQLMESYDVKKFSVKVKHDNGAIKIETTASDEEAAKGKVMKAEGCPKSAIISVKEK